MKNIWRGVALLALCLSVNTFAQAQEKVKDKEKDNDKYKTETEKDKVEDRDKDKANNNMSNKDMSERLTQDVYARNPKSKDAVIVWDNNDEGYDGTYAVGDVKYMTRYDKQGNYVETLTAKKWDDNVPSQVRQAYDKSMYKTNKVERFWEVNEAGRQGYYIEVKDNNGHSHRIWSDRDGKFLEVHDGKRDK